MTATDATTPGASRAAEMTVEEAASLTSGASFWRTEAVPRLGIASYMLTDGPHGLRKQAGATDHLGVAVAEPATCFPPAAGLGSTWNPELLTEVGVALGVESSAHQVSVLLGPGANIKRSPLCGRNFEYLSEDPVLSGDLAAALIRGIQSRGVAASLKHFAVNNQESDRMRIDAVVDERALREIYLASFERAVTQGDPWTVMCSYNKVNGTFASQNRWLLTEVLRDAWGFDGLVVSDWGAVNDRVAALEAGLDLDMPSNGGVSDAAVAEAVRTGRVDRAVLDRAVDRVVQLGERTASSAAGGPAADLDAHHALARRAAHESAVLLKNTDGLLPLDPGATGRVLVLGQFAVDPRYQGAGSSQVNPTRVDGALDALRELAGADLVVDFADGYRTGLAADDPEAVRLRDEAVAAVEGADAVVLFLGLPASDESEGYDRTDLDLPAAQVRLLEAVAAVHDRVVVTLSNGGVVSTAPWEEHAGAVLELWLGGQAGGSAAADLLLGLAEPSGRLAETVPVLLEHGPSFDSFPGELSQVRYGEGMFVGYRGFDARRTPVQHAFGHGLSYTTFAHGDAEVRVTGPSSATVRVTVTNTGTRAGSEVVQVYVRDVASTLQRPVRELKAFRKVRLQPGETVTVELELDRRAFAYWHPQAADWVVEGGTFVVEVGASSRDLRSAVEIDLDGDPLRTRISEWTTLAELMAHPVGGPVLDRVVDGGGVGLAVRLLGETSMITPEGMLRQIDGLPLVKLVELFPAMPFGHETVAEIVAEVNGS
ncbi:MAG TPA: glycoside hydrolase family 3 C-terminal domain-containing protein [Cellulomonas sp.]